LPSVFFWFKTSLIIYFIQVLYIYSSNNRTEMPQRLLSILLLLFTVLFSCEKVEPVFEYKIEPSLEVFVNRFYQEAELRGIILQKTNLIVEALDVLEEDRCGQCQRPKNKREGQRTVKISKARACWSMSSEQNREALVFHELGHCLLNREHKDDLFPSGAPKSIMTTVLNGPYQPCEYVFGEDATGCNKTVRRTYYLNELFDEHLKEVPSWSK
jgi:hypothetical protein